MRVYGCITVWTNAIPCYPALYPVYFLAYKEKAVLDIRTGIALPYQTLGISFGVFFFHSW